MKLCDFATGDCISVDNKIVTAGAEEDNRYGCRIYDQFEPGATYYFVVTAYNEIGESDYSTELSYTFPYEPTEVPTIPELFNLIFNNLQ
jgi:hypothetical protein